MTPTNSVEFSSDDEPLWCRRTQRRTKRVDEELVPKSVEPTVGTRQTTRMARMSGLKNYASNRNSSKITKFVQHSAVMQFNAGPTRMAVITQLPRLAVRTHLPRTALMSQFEVGAIPALSQTVNVQSIASVKVTSRQSVGELKRRHATLPAPKKTEHM